VTKLVMENKKERWLEFNLKKERKWTKIKQSCKWCNKSCHAI